MIKLPLLVLLGSGLLVLDAIAQSPGTFVPTGNMTIARGSHTATLLKDGRVLLTGGVNASYGYAGSAGSAELYDPSSGTFTATGNMTTNRAGHTATLLSDGRVLVAGEYTGDDTAELYDPATGLFKRTGDLVGGLVSARTANLLSNGKSPDYRPTRGILRSGLGHLRAASRRGRHKRRCGSHEWQRRGRRSGKCFAV